MELFEENTEIFDAPNLMCAEGCDEDKMEPGDVVEHLKEMGWLASNIGIYYDRLNAMWNWTADIKKPYAEIGTPEWKKAFEITPWDETHNPET